MRTQVRFFLAFVLVAALAVSVSAQFGPRMRPPSVRGVWSPVVGSGAVYQIEGRGRKMDMEIAVVGTETVNGKPGHWLETTISGEMGQMVSKNLMVLNNDSLEVSRMIMQMGDDEPMEMPANMRAMMGGGERKPDASDIRKEGELVGTESVNVPAGTFTCQHYKADDGATDLWIAENVAPYGLVKMTSKDGTMVLKKVVTNAKTKIRGTPKKFDPEEMMRQRPE